MNRQRLLSIDISLGTIPQFVDAIFSLAGEKTGDYVCVANVHMLVEAHKDPSFAQIVNAAKLVTPDGKPLCWGLRILQGIKQERVDGMTLMPILLKEASVRNVPVYFYGGTHEMLQRTSMHIQENYPELKIAGMYSPPFRLLTEHEKAAIVSNIADSGAGLVFVILGCPKQEKWMASVRGQLPAVMIGIGGALPVLVGMQKRAPGWMQRAGLEWFFRLAQEPKRLFKRYASTNTWFIWLLFKAWINKKLKKTRAVY